MSTMNQALIRNPDRSPGCIVSGSLELGLAYDLYDGLTEREGLIALLVARGCEDWQVAQQLHSDLPAIRQEIQRVMQQLNVYSTAELSETVRCIEM